MYFEDIPLTARIALLGANEFAKRKFVEESKIFEQPELALDSHRQVYNSWSEDSLLLAFWTRYSLYGVRELLVVESGVKKPISGWKEGEASSGYSAYSDGLYLSRLNFKIEWVHECRGEVPPIPKLVFEEEIEKSETDRLLTF